MKHVMSQNKLAPWLTHQGSITDKLKALTHHTQLIVLTHAFELSDTWDMQTLNLSANTSVLHREILMQADKHHTCWYARTILPKIVYDAEKNLFERLKTMPLGVLIHTHPDIQRVHIHAYEIHQKMQEYSYLTQALKQKTPTNNRLWGRVSTFRIRNQFDFYLLEIFLPGLLNYCP
jgi:chorismate--pyruvate lyase